MSHWVRLAACSESPEGSAREIIVGDRVVALFHVAGAGYFALDGVCPHQGGPLGDGVLDGATVTCPWHGWQFDVRTGRHLLAKTIWQQTLPLRVEADEIYVDLDPAPQEGSA